MSFDVMGERESLPRQTRQTRRKIVKLVKNTKSRLTKDSVYNNTFEWFVKQGTLDTPKNREYHAKNIGTDAKGKNPNWMLELMGVVESTNVDQSVKSEQNDKIKVNKDYLKQELIDDLLRIDDFDLDGRDLHQLELFELEQLIKDQI